MQARVESAGGKVLWEGDLPAIPRAGDRLLLDIGVLYVDRVTWALTPQPDSLAVLIQASPLSMYGDGRPLRDSRTEKPRGG